MKNVAKTLGVYLIMMMVFLTACNSTTVSEPEAAVEVVEEAVVAEELTTDNEADADDVTPSTLTYPIVDTHQGVCYDNQTVMECPAEGEAFYGQDAQYTGTQASYTDNGDGTVTDNVTGLVWQQSPDTDGDGDIDASDKISYANAESYCENLSYAGQTDWQLPTIKQLYSLIDFSGVDPSGYEDSDTSGLIPFIDTDYFDFAYGDTSVNERIIDSQYASSNFYVDGGQFLFGVNFADGRIKGYGLSLFGQDKTFDVLCVRENSTYGINDFADNGDGTISDHATGLMWAQDDSGIDTPDGLNWEEALAWVESQNAANYLGYSDWRMPSIKELQSIIDYSRSPGTTDSAAIDALFNATAIINEAGETDYGFYWSGTTHSNWSDSAGSAGAYVSFGRAMGYMEDVWQDVHGAGAQRSDPKSGDPADYPTGNGPQGDAIRIYNFVRLVRGGDVVLDVDGNQELVRESAGIVSDSQTDTTSDGTTESQTQGGEEMMTPPQEAVDACADLSLNDVCEFNTPNGVLSGTCQVPQDQLVCKP